MELGALRHLATQNVPPALDVSPFEFRGFLPDKQGLNCQKMCGNKVWSEGGEAKPMHLKQSAIAKPAETSDTSTVGGISKLLTILTCIGKYMVALRDTSQKTCWWSKKIHTNSTNPSGFSGKI